jgi:hypothetical protein
MSPQEIQARLAALWEEYLALPRPKDDPTADNFYENQIWPLIKELWQTEEFRRDSFGEGEWNFVASVHTLGTSREPVVLAALAAGAPEVHILHTAETRKDLGWIDAQLNRRVDSYLVEKDNPTDIYETVREIVEQHPDGAIAFDMTGGTKAMSSGLAAAAFFLQEQGHQVAAVYVDNKSFDRAVRRPVAGSEFPVQLPNPYSALGVLAEHMARERYRAGNFQYAQGEFEKLIEKTGDRKRYYPFALLARGYAGWYALNLKDAQKSFQDLLTELEADRSHDHPLQVKSRTIRRQLEGLSRMLTIGEGCGQRGYRDEACLKALSDPEAATWLVATFENLGGYFASRARNQLVLAALATYRGLELVMQHRLATYGVLAEHFYFDKLPAGTKEATAELGNQVFGGDFQLPGDDWRIGLSEGYLVLWALGDEVVRGGFKNLNELKTMRGTSYSRNESLLIHGFSVPTTTEIDQIQGLLTRLYRGLRGKGEFPVTAFDLPD